jgi:hypothetical protein
MDMLNNQMVFTFERISDPFVAKTVTDDGIPMDPGPGNEPMAGGLAFEGEFWNVPMRKDVALMFLVKERNNMCKPWSLNYQKLRVNYDEFFCFSLSPKCGWIHAVLLSDRLKPSRPPSCN